MNYQRKYISFNLNCSFINIIELTKNFLNEMFVNRFELIYFIFIDFLHITDEKH